MRVCGIWAMTHSLTTTSPTVLQKCYAEYTTLSKDNQETGSSFFAQFPVKGYDFIQGGAAC